MFQFARLTLAQRYMLLSFLAMLAGTLLIGTWVARLIERGVTERTAAVTALYVDSYVSPYLQELGQENQLRPENVAFFERLLSESLLGREILSFKVWTTDGTVVYSSAEPELVGQQFPIGEGLEMALAGDVFSELSDLEKGENAPERQIAARLIETYAPVRTMGSGDIIAASEFYQSAAALEAEVRAAQLQSWLIVAAVMLVIYLLLAGIVKRASEMILAQQSALQKNLTQVSALLQRNEELAERVQRAAARTTALNERYLRRISSDLHDGPAQDLALALLRMEALGQSYRKGSNGNVQAESYADFEIVEQSVASALEELRAISAGLRLPDIEPATIEDTVRRAVRDYEQKSGCNVALQIDPLPSQANLSIKITLYRVIKEALNNGFYHAGGKGQSVSVRCEADEMIVEIHDTGAGFDPTRLLADDREHLGLRSMAERVELLGGRFQIDSQPGKGTTVRARLPLSAREVQDA